MTKAIIEGGRNYFSKEVFSGCSNLKNITLGSNDVGKGLNVILSGFFSGFNKLESVIINNSITSIKAGAFASCINIESVAIPESVTTIESQSFYGWTSSQTISVLGYTSKPSGYADGWNGNANVVWKTE